MNESKTDHLAWSAVVLGLSWLAAGWLLPPELPFPFVWRDVAIVSLLSSLWLATLIVRWLSRFCRTAGLLGLALCCLAISAVSLLLVPMEYSGLQHLPLLGSVLRIVTSLVTMTGLLLLGGLAIRRLWRQSSTTSDRIDGLSVSLGVAILVLLPAFYQQARSQHDLQALAGRMEQSRLGEASTLARRMQLLSGRLEFKDRPLAKLQQYLDQIIPRIERRASQPLSSQADQEEILGRARDLAILGRTDEALEVLHANEAVASSASGANLRGTIYETKTHYREALENYQQAEKMWSVKPFSESRTAGLSKAITGIAYCQRKLGQYRMAEAAYQQLLDLAPTAETHFLLAQFYDDAQQPLQAKAHAIQAMQIDPAAYQKRGAELISKLRAGQFGCWGI